MQSTLKMCSGSYSHIQLSTYQQKCVRTLAEIWERTTQEDYKKQCLILKSANSVYIHQLY